MRGIAAKLTSPPLLDLLCPLGSPPGPLLLLLLRSAAVEVLHHDTHEHVQHEEAHQKEERDEVDEAPLVEVLARLQRWEISIHFKQKILNWA